MGYTMTDGLHATHASVDAFIDHMRRRIWIHALEDGATLAEADDADRRIAEAVRRVDPQAVDGVLDLQPVVDAVEDEFGLPRGTFVKDFVEVRAAVAEAERIAKGGH